MHLNDKAICTGGNCSAMQICVNEWVSKPGKLPGKNFHPNEWLPLRWKCFNKYAVRAKNLPLTHSHHWHRIAPNMLKSTRWFAFYFYYGLPNTVAVGGA